MGRDFGAPPQAARVREMVAKRLKDVREAGGVTETLTVEWRENPVHVVEVVSMPVAALSYNPVTHRIRAQRSHNPVLDRALDEDPWGEESQDYLHYLLKALPKDPSQPDPEFEALMESLRDFKQNDPGLITWDGVLVNGNSRRAALKELGVPSIRVGILPESCTWDDVSAVELSLQLRKDHRRDYSYINYLIAIEEQVAYGRRISDIATYFRKRQATCEQDLWILSCLRDLVKRSSTGTSQLRLMDFEEHQEKLRELHRRYVKEAAVNRDRAEVLKENRLAAVALGLAKTDLRLIEPDFQERYLNRALPAQLKAAAVASPAAVAIPGMNRTVKAAGAEVAAAKSLTDTLLRARAEESSPDSEPSQALEASKTVEAAKDAFAEAVKFAKRKAEVQKRQQAAPERIASACQYIELCISDLVAARASNSLDEESFDEAVQKLRGMLRKLAIESARSIKSPGDGVAWLLEAAEGQKEPAL